MRKVSSRGGQCRSTTWRVSEFVSKFWGKSCLIMVKCAIVTLQNIRRLSVICPPFCPFKSTYSSLAFPEVLLLLLLVLFPHLCNFLGTCWNHVTSPCYFSILKSWNFCWWHINLDLMYHQFILSWRASRWFCLFFVLYILLGVYFITSLILAVVYDSFKDQVWFISSS